MMEDKSFAKANYFINSFLGIIETELNIKSKDISVDSFKLVNNNPEIIQFSFCIKCNNLHYFFEFQIKIIV